MSSDEDSNVNVKYNKQVSKAEQKWINKQKKVKNYDKNDVFKVHEILMKKLGKSNVDVVKPGDLSKSTYICRVILILNDIKNYKRKPISPGVCKHLVLKNIRGMINNYKNALPNDIMCCTECGLETYEPLDLDEELHKLIISYFKIANQYAWYLNLSFRVEIIKHEVLSTIDSLLLVGLKDAARNFGIVGFSQLRKAPLKNLVFKFCTS